ncbi:MAG: two-component regulator propeller domain-containing protein [Segetibacter sp.]
MKYNHVNALFLMFVFCTSCKGQNKTEQPRSNIKPENKEVITSHPPNSITRTINSETKDVITSHGPNSITRNIIQDRKGNIWIASWEGIFRYDGKSFTNITSKVSSARFFSVLEDRKGNLWFGSIGSGVYYYDGKSFRNFTTKDGLANDGVTCIYEDKAGTIWFGTARGASRYDGKSFRNYIDECRISSNCPTIMIMMLILLLKTKQASFGLAQGAMPTYMMEKHLPNSRIKTATLLRMSVR